MCRAITMGLLRMWFGSWGVASSRWMASRRHTLHSVCVWSSTSCGGGMMSVSSSILGSVDRGWLGDVTSLLRRIWLAVGRHLECRFRSCRWYDWDRFGRKSSVNDNQPKRGCGRQAHGISGLLYQVHDSPLNSKLNILGNHSLYLAVGGLHDTSGCPDIASQLKSRLEQLSETPVTHWGVCLQCSY